MDYETWAEACWLCGEPAPDGVCLSEHLDYDHEWAKLEGHVYYQSAHAYRRLPPKRSTWPDKFFVSKLG